MHGAGKRTEDQQAVCRGQPVYILLLPMRRRACTPLHSVACEQPSKDEGLPVGHPLEFIHCSSGPYPGSPALGTASSDILGSR